MQRGGAYARAGAGSRQPPVARSRPAPRFCARWKSRYPTIFAIENNLSGIFNLASKQHPTKEKLYSFNAQKYNFEKPIFLENEFSINRTIDGSKIEKLGFNYQYFDAFNF